MDPKPQLKAMLLCSAIILASVLLRVDEDGRVLLPYTQGPPLPGSCFMRNVLHIDCPACGMSRSFITLADGQLARSFAFHRLGPLVFVYVLFQIPLRAYAVLTGRTALVQAQSRHTLPLIWALLIALFVNWGYNVVTGSALHWIR